MLEVSKYLLLPVLLLGPLVASGAQPLGEVPALARHLDQADIEAGRVGLPELEVQGRRLFLARFNALDGQGRPGSTGTGAPRTPDQPAFIRTSAPESNSCAGCHAQPVVGGAGDIVANVFVLAQALDPVTDSVAAEFSNERNTLGMHGSGPIEMLAREMTIELQSIRDGALLEAERLGPIAEVTRDLTTKGVSFGRITARGDGRVSPGEIEGVDWDLVVKPFHQKGAVVSLREFTNNALNHHHGMQAVERFGPGVDPDLDGVTDEVSVGDLTAITIYQAALATPTAWHPTSPADRALLRHGEEVFSSLGCAACHLPELELASPLFVEPNPFNPPGNLRPQDTARPFSFDMTRQGEGARLRRSPRGGALVRAFTDLKRHDLNDADLDHFANEQLPQGTLFGFADPGDFYDVPAEVVRPTREFLTRKLWDAGSSMPYGHRGDLTTLTEAIEFHGGEGRGSREAFLAAPEADRQALIAFLKSLRVVSIADSPCGHRLGDLAPGRLVEQDGRTRWMVEGDGALDVSDVIVVLRAAVGLQEFDMDCDTMLDPGQPAR